MRHTQVSKTGNSSVKAVANHADASRHDGGSAVTFADNRPEALQLKKLQLMADNGPQAAKTARLQAMANGGPGAAAQRVTPTGNSGTPLQKQEGPEEEELQLKADSESVQRQGMGDEELQGKFESIQRQENHTGMPDNLKSGIENLSGISMDDVKVHYNSAEPVTVQALAYTQGTDIHVGPGQEKHLPHEAWHVAQQKQGRVRPTTQMQGLNINDNAGLEKEADVMGTKAIQRKAQVKNPTENNRAVVKAVGHALQLKKLQLMADNSPQAANIARLQAMANSGPKVVDIQSGKTGITHGQGHNVIQKKDPGTYRLDNDTLLTHGTAANVFDVDTEPFEGFSQTTSTDKPGGPAWLAQDNEPFSVHAALVTQGYKRLGDADERQMTVHTYRSEAMDLHSWNKWGEVPEYLYREGTTPGDYHPGGRAGDELDAYGLAYAKLNPSPKFKSNSTEAARAIKNIAGGDGYHIDEDLIRGEPEEILFETGLAKIATDVKREFNVSWILHPKKQLHVEPTGAVGDTYYWDPSAKKVLSTTEII